MSRCPTCGSTFGEEARYCTRDGTKLIPGGGAAARRSGGGSGSMAGGPHSNLVGQVLDRRYQVERKIGAGGMSVVYLASEMSTGDHYAIKVLSPALSRDRKAMARLRREAKVGMRLAHPNVCHIMRLGETPDGLVYVVMPFLRGEILSDRNTARGVLPLGEVVRHVRDIAAGLQAAHEQKIVHRDLKPENVMIARSDDGGERAVVMDFGLAKEHRTEEELQKLTTAGMVLGTPEFMSPEQLRGKPIDGRTDVYALALMAFEMLTGQLPFPGTTQQEMMISRLRDEPMTLRQARPDLTFSDGVERVLSKGMCRAAKDRYRSAPELARELEHAAGAPPAGGMLSRLFGS